jgi:acyl-CoA synthetase (AMP-forming)/AMP-acid ligase II
MLAFLQYTSGSTSSPKGVMVSHANLCANLQMISVADQLWRQSTRVGWIPLFHDMGLVFNVLQATYVGALCVLMAPEEFVRRPLSWLRAIHQYRAETAIAPNFAYDLCTAHFSTEKMEGIDLSCWKLALNGAEPVHADTLERFGETFSPYGFSPSAFHPTYGMAEATLMISGGRLDASLSLWTVDREALKNRRATPCGPRNRPQTLVGCGRALDNETIAMVDPDTKRRLARGEIGEIWVQGSNVAQGYWEKPEGTREIFRAQIDGEESTFWLRTGDLGCLDETGELYLTGRIKDVIIIRGANYYPQDIERSAERSHPALRPGHSAAFSVLRDRQELLLLALEVRKGGLNSADIEDIIGKVRMVVVREYDLTVYSVILTPPGTIPMTTSGKIRRQATRMLWEKGGLQRLDQPCPRRKQPDAPQPTPLSL